MRIAHIGHGRLPIPPTAHGAVEDIIWNYKFHCEKLGHEFLVVNKRSGSGAMQDAFEFDPDVIHVHDESKVDYLLDWPWNIKIVTTHDPTFFEKPNPFLKRFVEGNFQIGYLSALQCVEFSLVHGVDPKRMMWCPSGARADLIRFSEAPKHPDRMICLGMIEQRKRQNLLLDFPFVQCVGPIATYDPIVTTGLTFESWTRQDVCERLTDYAALVLLSKSEAAPLVVMEALMAGLDVIVSEAASANLDRNQPFVHVLDEGTINNPYLLRVTLENILKTPKDRAAVRKYAETHHNWSVIAERYVSMLTGLLRYGNVAV